jgi:hypothetical protein
MAKHLVKCLYCGVTFDADKEPFAKPKGNRYAHQSCYDKHMASMSQEERDYEELIDYIKTLLGDDINPRVWKQLKEYKESYKYSYSGILKTLKWWYELKGNSVEKANGAIGIVPYVYQQACQYYYALYLAAIANEDKDIEHYQATVREFIIEPPTRIVKPPKLFNLDDLEEEENV